MKKITISILTVAVMAIAHTQQYLSSYSSYHGYGSNRIGNQVQLPYDWQEPDLAFHLNPLSMYRSNGPARVRMATPYGVRVLRYGEWVTIGGVIRQ